MRLRATGHVLATFRVAGIAAVVLIGLSGCGTDDVSQPASYGRPAFGVFHTVRSKADVLPTWAISRLLEIHEKPFLSSRSLRAARRVLSHQEVWLVPAEGDVCLVGVVYPLVPEMNGERLPPSVGRLCLSEAAAEKGQLFEVRSLSTTIARRLPMRVEGIVPDGVHRVTIRYLRGASRTEAVTRNAYEATVVNPHTLSFVTDTGGQPKRHVISLPSVAGASPTPYRQPRR